MNTEFTILALTFAFLSLVFMNLVKRNSNLLWAYIVQSSCVLVLLTMQTYEKIAVSFSIIFLLFYFVKIVLAPVLFSRFIRSSQTNLPITPYLKIPQTVIAILLLLFFTQSEIFSPITKLFPQGEYVPMLVIGTILLALLLLINRKGAIAQIVGLLALENAIVTAGLFMGFEQSFIFEVALLLDLLMWILVAFIFVRKIYSHFTSIDVSQLNQLKK